MPSTKVQHMYYSYERSAFFFQCAVNFGNGEAFSYLGTQYKKGLGMGKNVSKAVELYTNGAELEDPESKFEMGYCLKKQ